MNSSLKSLPLVWCISLALFILHLAENRVGYDAATGLAVPTLTRYALIGSVALAALYTAAACRKAPVSHPLFADHFAVPEKSRVLMVSGSFLFLLGGIVLGLHTVKNDSGIAPLVTAVLALASGIGFLVLTKQMRNEEADSVMPLLPSLFFSAFWVLSLYLPAGNDPILARCWLPILAAGMDAYALAQLAGFFRTETKVRSFNITGRLAVMLSAAAAADLSPASTVLFLGCAVVLSVFLALQKD